MKKVSLYCDRKKRSVNRNIRRKQHCVTEARLIKENKSTGALDKMVRSKNVSRKAKLKLLKQLG